jgi:hypothetical protein
MNCHFEMQMGGRTEGNPTKQTVCKDRGRAVTSGRLKQHGGVQAGPHAIQRSGAHSASCRA